MKERATVLIQIRVQPKDKAGWIAAAQRQGLSLTRWMVSRLNIAALMECNTVGLKYRGVPE